MMNVSLRLVASLTAMSLAVGSAVSAEVELIVAEEMTLTQALAAEGKTLGVSDDLVKKGTGKLKILGASDVGSALPSDYAGNILVSEGVLYVDAASCVGTAAGYTKVFDGAQLQTDCPAENSLSFGDEQFIIEGNGPTPTVTDAMGAILCLSSGIQYAGCSPFGNKLTLSDDATINMRRSLHSFTGTVNLDGHVLTAQGEVGLEKATFTGGDIILDTYSTAKIQSGCNMTGKQTISVLEGSRFTFSWAMLSNCSGWTLQSAGTGVEFWLGNDGWDYSGWYGPIQLDRSVVLTASGDNQSSGGIVPTMNLYGKISGPGGFRTDKKGLELRLRNAENDFEGGVSMDAGILVLFKDGALPRDGGRLCLTNSTLRFDGVTTCSLPSAEFVGACTVCPCSGTFKDVVVKSGDGVLEYGALLGSDVLDVRGGSVRFAVKGVAAQSGLNKGYQTYDTSDQVLHAYTNDAPFLLPRIDTVWNLDLLQTNQGWAPNLMVTYDGYLWNTTANDVTWTWHCCVDDACSICIDGVKVIGQKGWTDLWTKDITLSPGPHRFVARAYNAGGGAGASDANGAWHNTAGAPTYDKGVAVDFQARGEANNSDFYTLLQDAGDGLVFTTAVSAPQFPTMKFRPGTGLDLGGVDYTVAHLEGAPALTHGALTVTSGWKLDGVDLASGATAVAGRISFANAATLEIADCKYPLKDGKFMATILTAEDGIDGLPTLFGDSKYVRSIEKSADGKSIVFQAVPKGLVVIVK